MRLVGPVLLLALVACGGSVAPPDPAPGAIDGGAGCYTREESALVLASPPGESSVLELSCDQGDTFSAGGCDFAAGLEHVEDEGTGVGWVCAARSSNAEGKLRVWISCCRP